MPNAAGGEGTAWDVIPDGPTLPKLGQAVQECRACRLHRSATQAVFGEGPRKARVMMIGEQPGDREDLAGRPFVGPAGAVLDKALDEAGIDRNDVYVTNVVKHFKFEPRGKRRIHKRPAADEIAACSPWLQTELMVVHPEVVVALGATAAQALLGGKFRVTRDRGLFLEAPPAPWANASAPPMAPWVTATVHPSSILRAPDEQTRHSEMRAFVRDLHGVAKKLRDLSRRAG